MKYFEITTDDSARPNKPEDNTVIIKAASLSSAIYLFENNRGSFTVTGQVVECKRVYYVFDNLPNA